MATTSLRRLKKPLIEKKRRDRINKSLSCLKTILLDNIRRNGGTQTTKLDKADILEMTVTYLRMMQYGNSAIVSTCNSQYNLGYEDCAKEALRYLGEVRSHGNEVTSRLGNHLFHTQSILENCNQENYRESSFSSAKNMSLTVEIPSAHVQNHQYPLYSSSNLLLPAVTCDDEKYGEPLHTFESCTSGYSSQSDTTSNDVILKTVESCSSSDSERSASPMDVWRPW